MSNRGSWKDSEGDYLLVISGTTRHAPFLAGWRNFKDHIRNVVKEQPGWADVYPSQSHRRGEMQGWARLKLPEDTDSTYKAYSRYRCMLVHVWETRRGSGGFRLLKCNCSSLFAEVPDGTHSLDRCGIDLGRIGYRGTYTTVVPQYGPPPDAYPYGYPDSQAYGTPGQYGSYAMPSAQPVYSVNQHGMPVNLCNGAVLTEARGIFIQNLSFRCTPSDLYQLLLTVGHPVDQRMIKDARTGVFKGAATAVFGTKEQAQHAAYYLHGVKHMGMTLSVRMDKETTAIGQTGPPLIVGSDMYRGRP